MTEVQCPRCQQYWYTNEEDGGSVRLCVDCASHLQRDRRSGQPLGAFFYAVIGVTAAVVILCSLAAAWPRVFEIPLAVIGALMWLPGAFGVRRAVGYGHVGDADSVLFRWSLLLLVAGSVCILSLFSFVLRYGGR